MTTEAPPRESTQSEPRHQVTILPEDRYNQELLRHVHPPDWVNPEPADRYNMVVIGAGTAGLVAAAITAGLGGKAALIERHLMGGDCLNVGCVPSKGLLRAARAWADVRDAGEFGVEVPEGARVDFGRVMERMRRLRTKISPNDSARRFSDDLGVDVFLGGGRFVDHETIEVAGRRLKFTRALIATGGRASAPPIPGLEDAGYLTNESIFTLTERPARLGVVGAGPIGCEMAQAFARFGSRVTLLERGEHILSREDEDAARVVQAAFERDGVEMLFNSSLVEVRPGEGAEKVLVIESGGARREVTVDAILVAAGRTPNVENLGLEAAGVQYDTRRGVHVDDTLRTSNPRVYAAGDVCFPLQFTHTAEAMARIVAQNALFPFLPRKQRTSRLVVPWVTYTDPELAHVGWTVEEARKHGVAAREIKLELADNDRAILDGEEAGFLKVYVEEGKDRIVGATLVARHAGEMIGEVTNAIVNRVGLAQFGSVIHAYPTQAQVFQRAGDAFKREGFTPLVQKLFRWILARQR